MSRKKSMYMRSLVVLVCIILIACFFGMRLFGMQVVKYDYYLGKVLDNLTQISVIKAERGQIYDRNMQALAVNITTYRVFISPADIKSDEDRETICTGLSEILDVDYDEVMKKALKDKRKDETIKKDVDKETADKVRSFIEEHKYTSQIHLEATTKRYYPYEDLASQVIGYLGTDGGLFGLELQYNSMLTGTDGKYITARNARSQSMPSKYDVKIDPENGSSLITTIDVNIQAILENYLQQTYEENLAGNGACGIVMEVDTGAIRAMATVGGCDLNTPFKLTDDYAAKLAECGLDPESEEYNEYKWELIYSMWKNKCISDTYEPGSTFKIMTSAIALETGVVKPTSVLSCAGSYKVADTTIRCHKHSGHGTNTFSYLLQQSCNPCMMQVAEMVGTETFWKYFGEFGYLDKTGIDLPGEAAGINHTFSRFNAVELATSSFGQTFKTTPIQQLTAVCSIANGGHVVTPYIVDSVIDGKGNVICSNERTAKRQIVSEEVCRELAEILAGGVVDGVARNAYVAGYRVAAKTGTSEKRDAEDKTLRVGSTVAFAPADNPKIAVLIVVDEPGSQTKSGGTVAAPYVASVLNETLQYLGVGRVYTDAELASMSYQMEDCTGKQVSTVQPILEKAGLSVSVIGTGDTVYSQLPAAGEQMRVEGGKVYLYTYNAATGELPPPPEMQMVPVPNVTGYKVSAAISTLVSAGFNVQVTGSINYEAGTGAVVMSQSIPAGESAAIGTVIVIESMHTDVNDNG